MIVIYRQEIIQDIRIFSSQPSARFYDNLFINLNLSFVPEYPEKGRKGFSNHHMICSFIVMKCEGFSMITDLVDYLNNNLLISHFCGFDITKSLPSYSTFERFIKNIDNSLLSTIMNEQVLSLSKKGIIDTSFIGLDSTNIAANTSQNNPKSFISKKFEPSKQPKADLDCKLGVHTASNQTTEKKYEFFWGYKNHVLVDCITGLPICETTTTANIHDSKVAIDILNEAHKLLSLDDCYFIADKAYDTKKIHNYVCDSYNGKCFIPINQRNTKNTKLLPNGHIICEAGLTMHKDGKSYDRNRIRQKFSCPFKSNFKKECPCNNPRFHSEKKTRGCTKWVTLPSDYRLSIDRNDKFFKSTYALRTECERYNSRFKYTGQTRMWIRNIDSVRNLNTIAHISLLAVAIATIITNDSQSYRKMKTVKRIS